MRNLAKFPLSLRCASDDKYITKEDEGMKKEIKNINKKFIILEVAREKKKRKVKEDMSKVRLTLEGKRFRAS